MFPKIKSAKDMEFSTGNTMAGTSKFASGSVELGKAEDDEEIKDRWTKGTGNLSSTTNIQNSRL